MLLDSRMSHTEDLLCDIVRDFHATQLPDRRTILIASALFLSQILAADDCT